MTERLFVQTDGVLSYADIHDEVASGLSQLIGAGAAGAADVRTTHGTIAAAVDAALSGVLGTRQDTMQTTVTSGTTIGEILKNAARLYEEGDLQGTEKLRAAAEAMAGGAGASDGVAGSGGAPGAGPAGGTGAASSGGEMVGQMVGQVGQQIGQLGQLLSGLTQGLQQVMQGVQQAGEAAQSGADEPGSDKAGQDTKEPQAPEKSPRTGDHAAPTDSDPQMEQPTGAAPGQSLTAGPAPDVAPRPAPTRPAVDESAL